MVFSTLSLEKHISGFVALVNTELFSRVLTDLAREFELSQNKRMLLVLDQAGWHTTDKLVLPEGMDLFFLPSHSPELQPVERLWPLTNEAIANHSPENLDEARTSTGLSLSENYGTAGICSGVNLFSLVASN